MKILIIHTIYSERGGEEVIVETEANQLRQIGYDVKIKFFLNDTGKFKSVLKFILMPFNFCSYFKIKKVLKSFRPDVVHLHNWNYAASPSVINAVTRSNIPLVVSIHNYRLLCPSATLYHNNTLFLSSLTSEFPWEAVKKGVYRNSIIQSFWLAFTVYIHRKVGTWKSVNKFIVNTEFKRHLFLNSNLALTNEQIVVKSNSTQKVFIDETLEKSNFFLFVGRLNEEKGIRTLLSAFTSVNFDIVILGDGPLKSLVEEYSECNPNIIYKGKVSNSEVKKYMLAASALIFPSIWYEGMPMTIIESFSVSTPVIASKLGAMDSMIQNGVNGLLFETGDVQALIKQVQHWDGLPLENKNLIKGGARKAYFENYTPEKNVNVLISIYGSVIFKVYT